MLKWVGEPPLWMPDGWRVANWKYENRRFIAIVGVTREIKPKSCPGLSKTYRFGGQQESDFVQPVDEVDANLLMTMCCPNEFKDVTDVEDWASVTNDPVILKKDPTNGAFYREV